MTIRRFFEATGQPSNSTKTAKRPRLQDLGAGVGGSSSESLTASSDEERQQPYLSLPKKRKTVATPTNEDDTGDTPEDTKVENPGNEAEINEEGFDGGLDSSLPQISDSEAIEREELSSKGRRKSSLYVDAFNLALDTVLEDESYLFDEDESKIFEIYKNLPYEARYLYVRLFLRKTSAWFRVNRLTYFYDISDMPSACAKLQEEAVGFAENEGVMSFDDAMNLLNMDELRILAKEAKVPPGNKAQIVNALKKTYTSQSFIGANGGLQVSSTGTKKYLEKVISITGPCIRLTANTTTLFNRVHLVFYRSTEWTEKSLSTLILARIMKRNFPDYLVCRTANIFPTREALLDFENAIRLQNQVDELLENGVPSQEDLQNILDIADSVTERWETLCQELAGKMDVEEIYLRRFSAAWVYTRIIHKGLYVMGRFKQYSRERETIKKLLKQRLFHPSRRGGWYQRLALIEEHYFHDDTNKKDWLRTALFTCELALQDPDTHVIYHYELQKRITKLEKKLNIVKREQHVWLFSLRKPTSRTIIGDRIINDADAPRVGQKTLWKLESGEEVSVEEMCLDQYRKEGWKGFHCEVPNVFQTAFQTCPLDLHTDCFYAARASEINHRLAAVSNGEGVKFVRELHKRECERKTYIIGLDWEYDVEEVCEIVECLGGEALMIICKVFCQEYKERASGMPDLFLWDYANKKAKFAEVKSENDRLSDTQRVWIDALTGAGVEAELCLAVDRRNVKTK